MTTPDPLEGASLADGRVRGRVGAALLHCETCGRTTSHRILYGRKAGPSPGSPWGGVARCRACGTTHRFEVRPQVERSFEVIVSRAAVSERTTHRLPGTTWIRKGSVLPGSEPSLEVRRIVTAGGPDVAGARASTVATVWTVPYGERGVLVSVIEGARTRSVRWRADPDRLVEVGERLTVDGASVRVQAIRAEGRTWRRPGDRFRTGEIQRLYGRRIVSPPAGRSDWSNGRERPSSRTSSRSRSARSRSSPGVKITRTVPRRRTASGGATVHRVSPS